MDKGGDFLFHHFGHMQWCLGLRAYAWFFTASGLGGPY